MSEKGRNGVNLRYEPGAVSAGVLRAEISSALAELSDPSSDLARATPNLDLGAADFTDAEASVDQEGKGFGDVIIIITIYAPAGNYIIKSVWDNLILPRVKSRLGADALGKEIEAGHSEKDDSSDDSES